MGARRFLLPLALALVAHAAAIEAITAIELPRPPSSLPLERPEIDIEMPGLETATAELPVAESSAASATGGARTRGAKTRPAEVDSPKPSATEGTAAPPEEPPDGRWSFSPFAMAIDPRAALSPDLVAPHPSSPEAPSPRSASATGGLAEGLANHDAAIGMGRGGPVLSAVEDAARSSDAPVAGHATFEVVVGLEGKVQARVLSASADVSSWERVAAAAGKTLDPRRLRLPPGARGWRVVVDILAKEQLADGRDVKSLHGARASLAPSALSQALEGHGGSDERGAATSPGGPDHIGGDPTEPPPLGGALGGGASNAGAAVITGLATRLLPVPSVDFSGKVCSGSLVITPVGVSLGGGCSLENLVNPKVERIVSGHVVSEAAL